MAQRGNPAFDTENHEAPNSHKRFLEKAREISDDVQLAALFGVSVPTAHKWRSKPLGYKPGKHGRPRKHEVHGE